MASEKKAIVIPARTCKGRGKERLYSGKKQSLSVGLTAATHAKFKAVAVENNLSFSELIERLGRALTAEMIRELLLSINP